MRPTIARPVRARARLVAASLVVTSVAVLTGPAARSESTDEAVLAGLVNSARRAAGLPALTLHAGLAEAARRHSADMAATGTLFHTPQLGGMVTAIVPSWTTVAENSGAGPSVEAVHDMLMASPEHRRNVLGGHNLAGVGVVTAGDRMWVTELFVSAADAVVEPAPVEPAAVEQPPPSVEPPPVEPLPLVVAQPAPAPAEAGVVVPLAPELLVEPGAPGLCRGPRWLRRAQDRKSVV